MVIPCLRAIEVTSFVLNTYKNGLRWLSEICLRCVEGFRYPFLRRLGLEEEGLGVVEGALG